MEGWASQLARMGQEEAGKLEIPWSSVWDVQDDDRWWWAEGGTTGLNCDGLQVCRALVAFQATTRIEGARQKLEQSVVLQVATGATRGPCQQTCRLSCLPEASPVFVAMHQAVGRLESDMPKVLW